MITQFPRQLFSQVAITITSNESLGILDSDYVEDYNGNNGAVSIFHNPTSVRYQLLMSEVESETAIPHDVFRGNFVLAGKPDGLYFLQGRIRDIAGNYTVLGAIAHPSGNESVVTVGFEILTTYEGLKLPTCRVVYRNCVQAGIWIR